MRGAERIFMCLLAIQICPFSMSSSVQLLSRVRLCDPMNRSTSASLSITNSWSPSKPMSIVSMMPYKHLILCHPLLLLPSIFPSIRVFSNESAVCIRWPKYWTFSFNISSCNEYSGLISFRMDWLDLLVVQGTLKSLLQHHSSKAILQIPTEKFSFHCFISIQKISRLRIIFCLKFLNVGLAVQF